MRRGSARRRSPALLGRGWDLARGFGGGGGGADRAAGGGGAGSAVGLGGGLELLQPCREIGAGLAQLVDLVAKVLKGLFTAASGAQVFDRHPRLVAHGPLDITFF